MSCLGKVMDGVAVGTGYLGYGGLKAVGLGGYVVQVSANYLAPKFFSAATYVGSALRVCTDFLAPKPMAVLKYVGLKFFPGPKPAQDAGLPFHYAPPVPKYSLLDRAKNAGSSLLSALKGTSDLASEFVSSKKICHLGITYFALIHLSPGALDNASVVATALLDAAKEVGSKLLSLSLYVLQELNRGGSSVSTMRAISYVGIAHFGYQACREQDKMRRLTSIAAAGMCLAYLII